MLHPFTQMLYLDPAAVTPILVIIGPALFAVGVGFLIFFRRAKRKVAQVLHIDENAGKEVEDELVILEEEEK